MTQVCRPEHREHSFVSYHAITRYVQRILGVTVACRAAAGLDNRAVALLHCEHAGTTIAAVSELIALSPAITVARMLGASQVACAHFRAFLVNGIVTTITEPPRRNQGGFRSAPSRAELQRKMRRLARCMSHRPTAERIEDKDRST